MKLLVTHLYRRSKIPFSTSSYINVTFIYRRNANIIPPLPYVTTKHCLAVVQAVQTCLSYRPLFLPFLGICVIENQSQSSIMSENNSDKPVDTSYSDEEESVNQFLAAALREEIARRRASATARGLPNSRSDSSLLDTRIPEYLTGFRIPQLGSTTSQSSNGSLQGAFRNLNVNQAAGSTTSTDKASGSSEAEMETDETQQPGPSKSGTNPFQEAHSSEKQAENVSPQFSSDFPYFDSQLGTSHFFDNSIGTQTITNSQSVDSILQSLPKNNKKSKSKSLTHVASESKLQKTAISPLKLRRSSRLISKGENMGIKKSNSQGKPSKLSKTARAEKLKILSNLYKVSSPGLTQILDSFSPILPNRNKTGEKRALDLSPELIQPSKQTRTESLIKKQSQTFGIPPREQRVRARSSSRPRAADGSKSDLDESRVSSHARDTPPFTPPKQNHVSIPRVFPGAALTPVLRSPSHLMDNWPSSANLDEFVSTLSPPNLSPAPRNSQRGLNLGDILNQNADPIVASELIKTPSNLSQRSESSIDDSPPLCQLYPPRSLRGMGVRSKTSFQSLTGPPAPNGNQRGHPTDDPIKRLMDLCDNTVFTSSATCPKSLSLEQATNNTNKSSTTVPISRPACGPISPLTDWESYLKSHDSNPFSTTNSSTSKVTFNPSTSYASVVNTNKSVMTKHTNNSTNTLQGQSNEPIFKDGLSIWRELRNALTKDVVLRLRLKNLQTMVKDNLVPKWSVTYNPPSGLLTNQAQIEHVINVRRQIFRTQLECTIFLTEREINALKEKIDDLKSSLFALYQTKRGKKHNFDEALNQAVVQADRQRRATFEELNKRLMAIRQAPEEALHQNLPDLSNNQEEEVEEEPQPSTSAQAHNPPRSRPNQRWASNQGQGQKRPKSRSRSNSRTNDANQNTWIKVKRSKGKGKGKGKRSNQSNTNNRARSRDQSPHDEFFDLLAAFIKKHKKPGNK